MPRCAGLAKGVRLHVKVENCEMVVSCVCVGCSGGREQRRESEVGEGSVSDKEASLEDQMLEQSGYTSHGKCTHYTILPKLGESHSLTTVHILPLLVHTLPCIIMCVNYRVESDWRGV